MIELALVTHIYIYDGDNVRVNNQTTYRLVGHDAPEIRGACVAERNLAKISRDKLREIAIDGVLIPVQCVGSNFGRHCARLEVGGGDVSAILIKQGLATPYVCKNKCPPRINWCAP